MGFLLEPSLLQHRSHRNTNNAGKSICPEKSVLFSTKKYTPGHIDVYISVYTGGINFEVWIKLYIAWSLCVDCTPWVGSDGTFGYQLVGVWSSACIHSAKKKISSEGSGGISVKFCIIINSCYTALLFYIFAETTTQFSNCSTKCKMQNATSACYLDYSSEDLQSGICVRVRCARSYIVCPCSIRFAW